MFSQQNVSTVFFYSKHNFQLSILEQIFFFFFENVEVSIFYVKPTVLDMLHVNQRKYARGKEMFLLGCLLSFIYFLQCLRLINSQFVIGHWVIQEYESKRSLLFTKLKHFKSKKLSPYKSCLILFLSMEYLVFFFRPYM